MDCIAANLAAPLAEAGGALASALRRENSLNLVQRRFAWSGFLDALHVLREISNQFENDEEKCGSQILTCSRG